MKFKQEKSIKLWIETRYKYRVLGTAGQSDSKEEHMFYWLPFGVSGSGYMLAKPVREALEFLDPKVWKFDKRYARILFKKESDIVMFKLYLA